MVRFIIVRHGYSQGNREKRFSGQMDVPLDDMGRGQAESAAKYIADKFKVDVIYSSDLSRAFDTAKPLSDKLNLPINTLRELREVDVGKWQGMLIEDVRKEFPGSFSLYVENPGLSRFDGGESYSEAMCRGKAAFEKIADENDGKTVVVFTHGGIIRTLRAAWDNIHVEKIKDIPHVPNASITVCEYSNGKVEWIEIGNNEFLECKITETGVKNGGLDSDERKD